MHILIYLALASSFGSAQDFRDGRLRSDFERADPYIKRIIESHEAEFPGAMNYPGLNYYTDLDRLSRVQQGALLDLFKHPNYLDDWMSREPLTNLKITVSTAAEGSHEPSHAEKVWATYKEELLALVSPYQSTKKAVKALEEKYLHEFDLVSSREFSEYKKAARKAASQYLIVASLAKSRPEMEDLKAAISQMDLGALDYLEDELHWKQFFKAPKSSSYSQRSWFDSLQWELGRTKEIIEEEMFGNDVKAVLKSSDSITIREVHPNCAIFRGYVGNDCATSFSPAFVLTPFDRYYYVFDSKGSRLGYVGLSIVAIEGQKSILIHTIQGPSFNPEQVELVMRGFHKVAKSVFGAEFTVLAGNENISSNINYHIPRTMMMSAVKTVRAQRMEWFDRDYRKIIHKWESTMFYDDPDRNRYGRPLEYNTAAINVEINQKDFTPIFELPIKTQRELECERQLR